MKAPALLVLVFALAACDSGAAGPGTDDFGDVPDGADLAAGGGSDGGGGGGDDLGGGCGACNTPPDDCHAQVGTCQGGQCVYAFVDGATCDDGDPCTVADTCGAGGCFGTPKVCDTPPASVCLSSSQVKTFDAQGTCNGGLCVYASHTLTCSGGPCTGGSCATDPCSGVTCNTPPSACYGAAGTCSAGSCSYPYADGTTCNDGNPCTTGDQCNTGVCKGAPMACNAPPANVCENASTLRVYASSGSCSAGTCSYSYSFVPCPNGCASAMCTPGGWVKQTSNTNQSLLGVWGSSASAVWAVGQAGTAVFWNGAQWQVRTVPAQASNAYLVAIHGTAANNVFAFGSKVLIRFDGSQWNFVADLQGQNCTQPSGLFATGNATNDVYVSCWYSPGVASAAYVELYKVSGTGTITPVTSTYDGVFGCFYYSGGVWVFSPTKIWTGGCAVREWNGSMLSTVGTATAATEIWAANANAVFTLNYENYSGGTVNWWNGSVWAPLSTGFNGALSGVSGTAANRVFFSGFDSNNNGAVLYYDGLGFTRATLPAGVNQLYAIWAAPTGEVVTVGSQGTILKGP
jgi:hypothetical protein